MQSYVFSSITHIPPRRSCVVQADAPLHWHVHPMPTRLSGGWVRGFPYFGEAADLLDEWGICSRSSVLRILREEYGLSLGDALLHRTTLEHGELALQLADLSCGCIHTINRTCADVR